nr:MAG TPA: cysteine-rich protein [Caudoviricetes sp.]
MVARLVHTQEVIGSNPIPAITKGRGAVNINRIENVYCPVCYERYGRKKLLFKKDESTFGKIIIRCRGCKEDVELNLHKAEPLSRELKH